MPVVDANHIFSVRADLTQLNCDAWLLPCDKTGYVTENWYAGLHPWGGSESVRKMLERVKLDPDKRRTQVIPPTAMSSGETCAQSAAAVPLCIATVTGRDDVSSQSDMSARADWYAEGAVAFVRFALMELAKEPDQLRSGRERPLLAMPTIGIGAGGAKDDPTPVIAAVLNQLAAYLSTDGVRADVVLVSYDSGIESAVQAARRRRYDESSSKEKNDANSGPPRRDNALTSLAQQAARGDLVIFVGAGVSMGAGLPSWSGLLESLMNHRDLGLDPDRRAGLQGLDHLDAAQYLELQIEHRHRNRPHNSASGAEQGATASPTLGSVTAEIINRHQRYSLSHAHLANLPCNEYVTTNYDRLLEKAAEATGRQMQVLPDGSSTAGRRWLLKMHGCVTKPETIVLSRRSYLRYASRNEALAGILQALLMTKHMLFVGFGMQDANFSRIVDAVQRAREPHARPPSVAKEGTGRSGNEAAPRLGHALFLQRWEALESLWEDEVEFVSFDATTKPHGADDDNEARVRASARRVEIFLDTLVMLTAGTHHLLERRHQPALDEFEQQLAVHVKAIEKLIERHPAALAKPSAQAAITMLRAYGGRVERKLP